MLSRHVRNWHTSRWYVKCNLIAIPCELKQSLPGKATKLLTWRLSCLCVEKKNKDSPPQTPLESLYITQSLFSLQPLLHKHPAVDHQPHVWLWNYERPSGTEKRKARWRRLLFSTYFLFIFTQTSFCSLHFSLSWSIRAIVSHPIQINTPRQRYNPSVIATS